MNESVESYDFLGRHSGVFTDAAYVVVLGIAGVYLLHTLAKRFIYPQLRSTRIFTVVFGALYFLVLGVTVGTRVRWRRSRTG